MSKLELNAFNPFNIKPMSNFYIVGKRNCGKSNLLKNIIPYIAGDKLANRIGKVAAISETEAYSDYYRKEIGVHKDYICNSVNPGFIKKIIEEQQRYFLSMPDDIKSSCTDASNITNHGLLIVFDDVSHKKNAIKGEDIVQIMQAGRHFQTCIMMIVQDPLTMAATARGCFDYVFISGMPGHRERKAMRELYFGNMTESTFNATLKHYTENYGFLVFDCTAKTEENRYTYFRGQDLTGKSLNIKLKGPPMVPGKSIAGSSDDQSHKKGEDLKILTARHNKMMQNSTSQFNKHNQNETNITGDARRDAVMFTDLSRSSEHQSGSGSMQPIRTLRKNKHNRHHPYQNSTSRAPNFTQHSSQRTSQRNYINDDENDDDNDDEVNHHNVGRYQSQHQHKPQVNEQQHHFNYQPSRTQNQAIVSKSRVVQNQYNPMSALQQMSNARKQRNVLMFAKPEHMPKVIKETPAISRREAQVPHPELLKMLNKPTHMFSNFSNSIVSKLTNKNGF